VKAIMVKVNLKLLEVVKKGTTPTKLLQLETTAAMVVPLFASSSVSLFVLLEGQKFVQETQMNITSIRYTPILSCSPSPKEFIMMLLAFLCESKLIW
jgi:hypothetical protein